MCVIDVGRIYHPRSGDGADSFGTFVGAIRTLEEIESCSPEQSGLMDEDWDRLRFEHGTVFTPTATGRTVGRVLAL